MVAKIFLRVSIGLLLILMFSACDGGGGSSVTGREASLSMLQGLVVDQLAFYTDEELWNPDIELWVKDADSGDTIICASGERGMSKVQTEAVLYGNLAATMDRITTDSGYTGVRFRVEVHQNAVDPCFFNEDEMWGSTDDKLLGESDVINYDTLISDPVIATNGAFYVRLREAGVNHYSVPVAITSQIQSGSFFIDQVSWESGLDSGDSDGMFDTEIYILRADNDEFIACSGTPQGLGPATHTGLIYGKLYSDILTPSSASVHYSDYSGVMVKLVMIDNDGNSCPDPISTSGSDSSIDDIYGTSAPVLWDELPGSTVNIDGVGFVVFGELSYQ